MKVRPISKNRGSILLAVFWVIAVLSFAVVTCVALVLTDVELELNSKQQFEAQQWAEKGVAIAAHPLVKPWDPILRQQTENGEGFTVQIMSDGARLNLNAILLGNDVDLIQRIFAQWGLDLQQSQALMDAMQDWIDPDKLERINGAERDFYEEQGYQNQPFNRAFRSLDEVRLVAGMAEVDAIFPGWRNYFTLWSGSGKLDINEAPEELISLACGCTIETAQQWISIRRGQDKIENTQDDLTIRGIPEVIQILGLGGDAQTLVARRISFEDPTVRISSIGVAGDAQFRREMVLRRNEAAPTLLYLNDETR